MKAMDDILPKNILFEEFDSPYFFHGSSHNWFMTNFHFHKQHEILLVLGGGATLEVGNRKYQMEEGDLFLLSSMEYHRTTGAKGKLFERYVLQFYPEEFREISAAFGYNFTMFFETSSEGFIHKINLANTNLDTYISSFKKIERNIAKKNNDRDFSVRLKLSIMELLVLTNEIFGFFNAKKQEQLECDKIPGKEFGRTVTHKKLIDNIKKYIRDNIEQSLYLDIIAQMFSINRYHLCRYFKKETGFTLSQYITKEKLAKAMTLLELGHSVTEAAYKLSYSSDTHFISVFKKNCGITPKQYAKSKNSNNI